MTRGDKGRKLVCNIQGGSGSASKIDHLHEGIKLAMQGSLEKHSDILGRDAVWTKTTSIKALAPYICIRTASQLTVPI